jgi:hypothetical protein
MTELIRNLPKKAISTQEEGCPEILFKKDFLSN